MSGAYTVKANGVTVRWHMWTLAECADPVCTYPHATKAQLQEGLEWDRDASFEQGKDAGKGER